jgi:hypothetical protein
LSHCQLACYLIDILATLSAFLSVYPPGGLILAPIMSQLSLTFDVLLPVYYKLPTARMHMRRKLLFVGSQIVDVCFEVIPCRLNYLVSRIDFHCDFYEE